MLGHSKYIKALSKGIIFSSLLIPFIGKSQDMRFSMNHEAPTLLNPALSCTQYDTRVIANFRNQWATVSPYQTFGLSVEKSINRLKLKKSYIGVALNVFNDKAGDAGMSSLLATLGVNAVIKVGKSSKLSGGIGGGINYRTVSPDKFKWESQYNGYEHDPTLPSGEINVQKNAIQSDLVAGLVYRYAKSERYISAEDGTKFDIGFSVFHFNRPKYTYMTSSDDRLYTKYVGHANFDIGVKGAKVALMPSFAFSKQGPSQEINAGFLFKFIIKDQSTYTNINKASALAIGAFYRVGDAFIPAMLFQWDKYALGFCYDLNVSSLNTATRLNGAMEVTLRFNTSPGYGRNLGGSFNRPTYK